jgi:hypothetical protein
VEVIEHHDKSSFCAKASIEAQVKAGVWLSATVHAWRAPGLGVQSALQKRKKKKKNAK